MPQIEVLDPRHDPAPAYWEALRHRATLHANWSYPALRAAALTSRVPHLLAIARDGSDVLAVVSTVLSGLPLRRYRYAPPTGLRQVGLVDVKAPNSTAQRGWWIAPHLSAAEAAAFSRDVTRRVRQVTGARTWAVLWRHARTEDLPWLTTRRAVVRNGPATTEVDLSGYRKADDWYATLRRGRASDLRRQTRRVAEDPDLTVSFGPAATVVDPVECATLLQATAARNTRGPVRPPVPVAWLTALFQAPDAAALAYRDHAGTARAAVLVLDHPTHPLALVWGARDGVRNLYFDQYTRLVRWAIDTGKQRLGLGASTTAVKTSLGAQLVPEYLVLTGR